MLSPASLSVARFGDRTGKSAQTLWDSLPPCIALSQTKIAQPASQANSAPTVDPKTAAQATALDAFALVTGVSYLAILCGFG